MASPFITNALQVNFESVLAISDNEGMLNMFKALEANGLRGFLGCQPVLYETELEQFFDTALVQGGDITGAVSGKFFAISQSRFAEVLQLPTKGLVDLSDVPKELVHDAKRFSKSGEPISTYGKKKFMKYEFRLLNDILAKSITVKAGSFDAITNERFLMITAIHFGVKVNWSKILFGILNEMVNKTVKKAKGFAAQICVLLKSDPVITLGEPVHFPSLKVLSIKTVNTYVTMNETIYARGKSDEPGMAKVVVVKRKSQSKKKSESSEKATGEAPMEVISEEFVSKKRPTVAGDEPVVTKKKRTSKSKAFSSKTSKAMVTVAQDAEPLQIIEPTPAATAEQPPVPKRKSKNRRLVMPKDSDDEVGEEQVPVEDAVEEAVEKPSEELRLGPAQVETTDDVDVIIGQVIAETSKLETSEEGTDEFYARQAAQTVEIASDADGEPETIADKEKLQMFVETETVATAEGSKDAVVAKVIEKSAGNNPTDEEQMSLDDLLMQISDDMMLPSVTAVEITKIMSDLPVEIKEVQEQDWYYANLPKISATEKGKAPLEEADIVKGNPAREMVELICADVNFLVQMRDQAQQQEHGIIMDRTSSSQSSDDSVVGSGAVLAQFYSLDKSTCWPVQYWGAAPSLIKSWGWSRVCTDVVRYSTFGCLRAVRDENFCREIVVISSGVEVFEKLPTNLCSVIQQGQATNSFVGYFSDSDVQQGLNSIPYIDSVSSDGSIVYRSPSPQHDSFPSFQEAESSEPSVQLALALAPTVSAVDEDEQLYTIQSPDSSNSATDSSLWTSLSQFIATQTKATRRIDDAQNNVLSKLNTLEKDILAALRQHEEVNRTMIQNARQEARSQNNVLSLNLSEFRKGVHGQSAFVNSDLADVQKEQKAQKAILNDLDKQVATIRSELSDFRAKAEENYLNLSTQLGDIVDYIRGGDSKKGEGSSSQPRPPPDNQDRPTGEGSANRGAGIRGGESGGDGRNRGGSGNRDSGGQSRGNLSGSSKRRRSGGESLVHGIRYGPYPPAGVPKRSAKHWITGE
ncbi:hypothetical protein F511_23880 [Dorcoceras hygrometricum]|uniref:Dystroglycan-like n=1 Tax=Dorcoceras hygrometricum TaxID=472368 RepID=A0A2Z7BTR0_9LAMI|nr:hypothetical protein F511_23880 [Dorcoceras hygrometricum]